MPLDIYFLRHGETESSRTGTYCGSDNPDLTAAGAEMAAAFAQKYQTLAWQAVFCSPLKRTQATARPICQALGLEPQLREGLQEMYFGDWEGHTNAYVREHHAVDYIQWLTEPAWNPPTGGETGSQVATRAGAVISEIQGTYPEGNVLVVSHKTTIRIILATLLGIDLGRYRDRISLPVASVSLIRFDNHGPMLVRHGDRSHLSADLDARPGT